MVERKTREQRLRPRSSSTETLHERAFSFACAVIAYNDTLQERGASAAALGNALLASGTRIGIAIERAELATRAEFATIMAEASQQAREVTYWLRLIQRSGKSGSRDLSQPLLHEAKRLLALLEEIDSPAQIREKN